MNPVRLHVEEAFHGERHVVRINNVDEEAIRRPGDGTPYTLLECCGISVGEELPETSSDQLVGRDLEKRGDCGIAPPDDAVGGRHDEMDELRRGEVTSQQGSGVGSEFGEARWPIRVREAIENQNLRECWVKLDPAWNAPVGEPMRVAGVPVPERVGVGPPGEQVEDRHVAGIREDFHAEEAWYVIDQVRPDEKRITDRRLQAVPDSEAGDGLDHVFPFPVR